MSDSQFEGRIALVTGAASGIGAATARRLAAGGVAGLALMDRNPEGLAEISNQISAGGINVLTIAQDVGDPKAWPDAEGLIKRSFGRLDLAVANAGTGAHGQLAELGFEDWRRVLSTNLDGVFLTVSTAMRLMAEAGGAIVVNASVMASKAEIGAGAYAVSKAGAAHLGKVAADEGAPSRIRVNAGLPGGVEAPIWREVPMFNDIVAAQGSEAAAFATMGGFNPLGRYAKPEEIADVIAFLLSDACGFVTGSSLVCDGGYLL